MPIAFFGSYIPKVAELQFFEITRKHCSEAVCLYTAVACSTANHGRSGTVRSAQWCHVACRRC